MDHSLARDCFSDKNLQTIRKDILSGIEKKKIQFNSDRIVVVKHASKAKHKWRKRNHRRLYALGLSNKLDRCRALRLTREVWGNVKRLKSTVDVYVIPEVPTTLSSFTPVINLEGSRKQDYEDLVKDLGVAEKAQKRIKATTFSTASELTSTPSSGLIFLQLDKRNDDFGKVSSLQSVQKTWTDLINNCGNGYPAALKLTDIKKLVANARSQNIGNSSIGVPALDLNPQYLQSTISTLGAVVADHILTSKDQHIIGQALQVLSTAYFEASTSDHRPTDMVIEDFLNEIGLKYFWDIKVTKKNISLTISREIEGFFDKNIKINLTSQFNENFSIKPLSVCSRFNPLAKKELDFSAPWKTKKMSWPLNGLRRAEKKVGFTISSNDGYVAHHRL